MSAPYEVHLNDDENREGNMMGRHYVIDGEGGWTSDSAKEIIESVSGAMRHKGTDITITIHGPCELPRDHWWYDNGVAVLCYLCGKEYEAPPSTGSCA